MSKPRNVATISNLGRPVQSHVDEMGVNLDRGRTDAARASFHEKLVSMFARAELGLRPVQTFELEEAFFEEFRK